MQLKGEKKSVFPLVWSVHLNNAKWLHINTVINRKWLTQIIFQHRPDDQSYLIQSGLHYGAWYEQLLRVKNINLNCLRFRIEDRWWLVGQFRYHCCSLLHIVLSWPLHDLDPLRRDCDRRLSTFNSSFIRWDVLHDRRGVWSATPSIVARNLHQRHRREQQRYLVKCTLTATMDKFKTGIFRNDSETETAAFVVPLNNKLFNLFVNFNRPIIYFHR